MEYINADDVINFIKTGNLFMHESHKRWNKLTLMTLIIHYISTDFFVSSPTHHPAKSLGVFSVPFSAQSLAKGRRVEG